LPADNLRYDGSDAEDGSVTRRWSAGGRGQITDDVRAAITKVPAWARTPAVDAAGGLRDGAQVAEVTGLLELTGWPQAMRVIVRRERPHPGAQLDAFEDRDGFWYVMGNNCVTMFANLLYNNWITDVETCFELLPLGLYRQLDMRSAGFGMEAELWASCCAVEFGRTRSSSAPRHAPEERAEAHLEGRCRGVVDPDPNPLPPMTRTAPAWPTRAFVFAVGVGFLVWSGSTGVTAVGRLRSERLVEAARRANAQFDCIDRELKAQVPPGSRIVLAVPSTVYRQRLTELATPTIAVTTDRGAADFVVEVRRVAGGPCQGVAVLTSRP
jgi:hypothetical protein